MAHRLSLSLIVLAAGASSAGLALAGDGSAVVARVGDVTVTVADVQRRLATAAVGGPNANESALESARREVEQVLVPEIAAAREASQRGLDKGPRYLDREREVLRQALETDLRRETLEKNPVTSEEVKAYFDANRARFEQPFRIRIWRILLNDEASARAVLEQAKSAGSPAKWGELARDRSADKATNLRQGDLGFVRADGNTDVPRVRVDPALFRAAAGVKDGEIVPQPIKEGDKFAVVWRRGSLAERKRTVEQEKKSIQGLLERKRVDDARTALIQKLRSEFVHDEHPELLEQIPEGLFGRRPQRPRPTFNAVRPSGGLRAPQRSDRGLR